VTKRSYTISKQEIYELLSALLLLGTVLVLFCLLCADNDLSIGVRLQRSADIFLYAAMSKPDLEPIQPPSKRVQIAVFNAKKWLNREPEHSPPTQLSVSLFTMHCAHTTRTG